MTAVEVVGYVAAIVGLVAFFPAIVVLRLQRAASSLASGAAGRGVAPWWARIGGLAVTLAILAAQLAFIVATWWISCARVAWGPPTGGSIRRPARTRTGPRPAGTAPRS